jgi:hypothetical protein
MLAPSPVMDSIHCVVLSLVGWNVAGSLVSPAACSVRVNVKVRGGFRRGY